MVSELFVKVLCTEHTAHDHHVFVSVATLIKFMEISANGWTDEPCCLDEIVKDVEGRE